ncbi:Tat pathway signal sequence domain protein [Uniformispora flossi]|uniref:Tat pathway signal sequence domain protein n=1 Tax=Uniformispora flossi TaxID=3390723 RepID=UPI003C2D0B85
MNNRPPETGDIPAEETPPQQSSATPSAEAGADVPRSRRLSRVLVGAGLSVAAAVASIAIAIPMGASGESGKPAAAGSPAPGGSGAGTAGAAAPGGQASVSPGGDVPAESEPMGPAPATGSGRDPLTPDEIDTALRLAVDPALRQSARTVTGAAGPEPLTVDLSDPLPAETDPGKAPRRADVYFYNYADNTLAKRVVNLTAGVLERSSQAPNMQPAPSRTETAEALKLLVASPSGAPLKAQYKAATGTELAGPEQLDANGSSYIADIGDTATAQCGAHRCLILFVKVRGGVYLDTTRTVVDLSARAVFPPQ